MKKLIFGLIGLTIIFAAPLSTKAAPPVKNFTFTRTQVTSDDYKQTFPVVNQNTIFWSQYISATESDIYSKNRLTGTISPLIERVGDKIPIASTDTWLLYHQYIDETNWYDVYIYNLTTGEDRLIASGPDNQTAEDIYGNYVVYNNGFSWQSAYLYNIKTGLTKLIATEAIRPRMWGNTIVWIHSFGGGYATVWSYNLKTAKTAQVPSSLAQNETWPDIWQDKVVWQGAGIYFKDLKTDKEVKISESGENPIISNDFVTWVQSDSTGIYNIYGYDIKSGQTLKISDDGLIDSASRMAHMYQNTVVWTSGTTGQGDIWQANLLRQ